MQLGDLQVQGVDYAYTLQGWLKSINPSSVNIGGDLYDADGTGSSPLFERDAYKLNLNYYDDGTYTDYLPINAPSGYVQGNALPTASKYNLYNGNIGSIALSLRPLTASTAMIYNYRYDQLNRINSMDAWAANGSFAPTGSTPMQDYQERYSYDPNGKILTSTRWGLGRQLDNATYNYYSGTNRLEHIADPIGKITANDPGNQASGNYQWDAIGEMTADADRGLTNATWTIYGKIATQTLSNGSVISYTYDAGGNRISKTVSGTGGYTEAM